MAPLCPPSEGEIRAFLADVREGNPGIGILDLRSLRIHLACASAVAEGDHLSLAERDGLLQQVADIKQLRGFVVGYNKGSWKIADISGLNPRRNRMEPELFKAVNELLTPLLGEAPKD